MKIAIFGTGHVGSHVAHALCLQGLAKEILFFDTKSEKVISEINDLNDAQIFFPHKVVLKQGEYSDLADTDLIINSVGKIDILVETGDRAAELSLEECKQIIEAEAKKPTARSRARKK